MLITDYGINIGGSNIRSDGVLEFKKKKEKKHNSYMENLPQAATASSNVQLAIKQTFSSVFVFSLNRESIIQSH